MSARCRDRNNSIFLGQPTVIDKKATTVTEFLTACEVTIYRATVHRYRL